MVEDYFTHAYSIAYFNHNFARTRKFQTKGANAMLEAIRMNADFFLVEQFLPDLTASVDCLGKLFDLFIVEIKKPHSNNPGPYSELGKELKIMVDHLVGNDVVNPVVCGLVCAGLYSKWLSCII